jgi:anti-anti-sigma regulatory factor
MLRITPTDGDGERFFRLEGRLVQAWVDELLDACRATADGRSLVLDLVGVTFVDAAGAEALRQLQQQGATFRGCSGFVAALLKT